MVSYWWLSDSKSPQVSRSLLSILSELNNTVILMISTRPLISKPSSPFCNIWGSFQVNQLHLVSQLPLCSIVFFKSLVRSLYSSLFSLSFSFILWSAETAKSTFLLTITRSGRLAEIRWSVCMSKSQKVCASHFPGQIPGCVYTTCSYCQT